MEKTEERWVPLIRSDEEGFDVRFLDDIAKGLLMKVRCIVFSRPDDMIVTSAEVGDVDGSYIRVVNNCLMVRFPRSEEDVRILVALGYYLHAYPPPGLDMPELKSEWYAD